MSRPTLWWGADTAVRDSDIFVEGATPTLCIVLVLGFLTVGVYSCVFAFLPGAVRGVREGWPAWSVMEGWVWEAVPCRACVQDGRGSPFRLYGLQLVVLAVGDEDVGCCYFV